MVPAIPQPTSHRESGQASRFPDVYTFYLPLNALGASAPVQSLEEILSVAAPPRNRGTSTNGNDKRFFSEYKDLRANISYLAH